MHVDVGLSCECTGTSPIVERQRVIYKRRMLNVLRVLDTTTTTGTTVHSLSLSFTVYSIDNLNQEQRCQDKTTVLTLVDKKLER